jgi:sulfur-oxidizing protein SoxA
MMRSFPWRTVVALAGAIAAAAGAPAQAAEPVRAIALEQVRSGITFTNADVRAQQADDFLNPGMLWVDRGARAWGEPGADGRPSCRGCHGEASSAMKGVSARLPKADPATGRLVNLQGAINACRTVRQGLPALAYESPGLLALATFVGHQSRGMPVAVRIDGAAAPWFERGRQLYFQRMGQMNLACTHCHDRNWGRQLLTERISQGQGNAYPIYRLEWESAGTLHRRFRSCQFGVRAELSPQGSDDFLALELYVAWRGQGLAVETPGVRR